MEGVSDERKEEWRARESSECSWAKDLLGRAYSLAPFGGYVDVASLAVQWKEWA